MGLEPAIIVALLTQRLTNSLDENNIYYYYYYYCYYYYYYYYYAQWPSIIIQY